MAEPQRPPYYRVVPVTMWTAECVHCGRNVFADSEYVAWSDENSVHEVIDADGWWRCKCGAPLTEMEAELLAEADMPYHWTHRDPPFVAVRSGMPREEHLAEGEALDG